MAKTKSKSHPKGLKTAADIDDYVADTSRDVILDMYEEDLECDMDCANCSPLERQECVRELKQVTLVLIQKLNSLYADFNAFSRKIYKMLNITRLIDHIKQEEAAVVEGSSDEAQGPVPDGIFM